MLKRTHKVALMAVLTVVMVLAFAGVALAQWTDMSLSVVGPYGITEAQVGQISQGFVDGSWRPYNDMPRNQFVKMAVDAYKIPLVSPATPTYTDVPKTDYFFPYVEAATAAGLTNGVGGGKFEPNAIVTREQAAAIIVRWVADKNGYNLATYYTDAEAAAIVAAFPDAAQVGPTLVREMAFAIDFGIIWGTNTGTLAPKGMLSRIQGAALLIRSWGVIPFEPPVNPPAEIELVGADKSENLIGLAHTVTFKVTDAAGAPVAGALVDFDTLMAGYYYVGNISPKSGLTDAAGLAKCVLLSTEPGTQRVSATVMTPAGPKSILTTKYWVVLDEVYILSDTRTAQNNVGTTHEWEARVVVFGPGPLSTSAQDWYNAVSLTADPSALVHNELDGVDWPIGWAVALLNQSYQNLLPVPGWNGDWEDFLAQGEDLVADWMDAHADLLSSSPDWQEVATLLNSLLAVDRWSNNTEQLMLGHGYEPRTMAGVPVTWTIVPVSSTVASVGTISAVQFTGTIAADKKSAVGFTNADGLTSIAIDSTATGTTAVQVVADYAGNPYPEKLFNHLTSNLQLHFLDWDDQPLPQATAIKTWIPHTEGGPGDTKISPAFSEPNIGEEILLTLTLKDEFGNAISGKQVEWYMQGVGQFKSDDDRTMSGDGLPFSIDKDIDVTDAAGTARLLVKSLDPGEQIIHAKFRDKGINNQEGMWKEYVAEVQWFKVAIGSFDKPSTSANEAVSVNEVGTDHTFDFWVYGLKLEYYSTLASQQGAITQTAWIDTDVSGKSYDGVMDADDAKYLDPNGILIVNEEEVGGDYNPANGKVDGAVYEDDLTGIALGAGGVTRFDFDGNGTKETAVQMGLATGIYLPLQYKGVDFFMRTSSSTAPWNANWPTPVSVSGSSIEAAGVAGTLTYAGVDFTYDAVTDAAGHAFVTVTSTAKGYQFVDGIVDYPANPAKGIQRIAGRAWKTWTTEADPAATVKVTIDGLEVKPGEAEGPNPIINENGALNDANIKVHVLDAFGNELPDYEVVYEIVGNYQWIYGTQGAADTYHPWQVLTDNTPFGEQKASASLSTRYPSTNPVTNSALNQTFEKLTSIGTTHSGSFTATIPTGLVDQWSWEFTASGLFRLPVTAGGVVIESYTLWLDNGDFPGDFTPIANFNTDADGVIVGGKIFGSVAPDLIKSTTLVWVTGDTGANDPVAFVLGGAVKITGVLDGNGFLPDNSEPRDDAVYDAIQDGVGPNDLGVGDPDWVGPDWDWADDLAVITGKGGTEAYYFWRGQPKPPEQADPVWWPLGNPYNGDGAKAWTLNGIDPTLPHGSAVDVQLVENPYQTGVAGPDDDVRCIINIQIYKPANGPVKDGTPWKVFEVQKVWEPTARDGFTVGITPADDKNPVGASHTVTAVLPLGAQPWYLYFVWYVDDVAVSEGWGYDSFSYTGWVSGTDEIYYEVYAAPWADPIATSPVSYKSWSTTTVSIEQWDPNGDPAAWVTTEVDNTVGTTHEVRVDTVSGVDDPTVLYYQWLVDGVQAALGINDTEFAYSSTVPGTDNIVLKIWDPTATTVIATSNTLVKNWGAGAAGEVSNPFWAVKDLQNPGAVPVWRFDSRIGETTVTLPAGTPLVFRALVRDAYNNILVNTDVSGSYPKLLTTFWDDSLAAEDVDAWTPVSGMTDAEGYLYWTGTPVNTGYFGLLTASGDRASVTFWLDLDNDDAIDTGDEAASNVPGWGNPWAQWLFN